MRWKGSNHKNILVSFVILGILSLGIGYAAWTDSNVIVSSNTTSNFQFKFDSRGNDMFASLVGHDNETQIPVTVHYSADTLNVDGISASAMNELLGGGSSLKIYYRMVPSDNGVKEVNKKSYPLGNIDFQRSSTPIYSLIYQGSSLDFDQNSLELQSALDNIMPVSIQGMSGSNNIVSCVDGAIYGYVLISNSGPDQNVIGNINLSSFGLPIEVNQAIVKDEGGSVSLEISADYSFTIPLLFEQEY